MIVMIMINSLLNIGILGYIYSLLFQHLRLLQSDIVDFLWYSIDDVYVDVYVGVGVDVDVEVDGDGDGDDNA